MTNIHFVVEKTNERRGAIARLQKWALRKRKHKVAIVHINNTNVHAHSNKSERFSACFFEPTKTLIIGELQKIVPFFA